MHFAIILRILGLLLMLFSMTMLTPVIVAWIYHDGDASVFFISFLTTLLCGALVWWPFRKADHQLHIRDGFLITALFWFVLGMFGCLPFLLSEQPNISITDAVFESISGLTTTGATVLTGLDFLPPSVLYYRQQLQWLGGIGIIVIAVAILPMLGIGGMQLYRAETPGPVKDTKLTPRITGTAKALFFIYLSMTGGCALAYWLAGMDVFDAITHSFSTVSIGGFSTYDKSMAYFNSPAIMMVSIFYMVCAGINFALHYFAWRHTTIKGYLTDPEAQFYLRALLIATLVTWLTLYLSDTYSAGEGLLQGAFQVVSIATTTGFTSTDFSKWPVFLPLLLFLMAFMGACAYSTGGGIKVVRVQLMVKQGLREFKQLVHPQAIIPIKLGNRPVGDRILSSVWGFFALYMFCFAILMLLLLATGLDFITAFSAVGAAINNLGPGLGDVTAHYGDINNPAKWLLCFAMLLGRLEIFTLLVLFTPMFWRR